MIGQPYNPDNCAFVTNQALNTNQFNGNVPYSSNNTTSNQCTKISSINKK